MGQMMEHGFVALAPSGQNKFSLVSVRLFRDVRHFAYNRWDNQTRIIQLPLTPDIYHF
jgi:hypothetical protein